MEKKKKDPGQFHSSTGAKRKKTTIVGQQCERNRSHRLCVCFAGRWFYLCGVVAFFLFPRCFFFCSFWLVRKRAAAATDRRCCYYKSCQHWPCGGATCPTRASERELAQLLLAQPCGQSWRRRSWICTRPAISLSPAFGVLPAIFSLPSKGSTCRVSVSVCETRR